MPLPVVPPQTLLAAKDVWDSSIQQFGRLVTFKPKDDDLDPLVIRAFCKRPKILGQWDRTEQSYDQEKYMVIVRSEDFALFKPNKFDRVNWDDEDHVVLSVTEVDLIGTVFGYRVLVKG